MKLNIQLITAAILSLGGIILLFCGVFISPQGEIHESLLVGFGEVATFSGALFGIDYVYKQKSNFWIIFGIFLTYEHRKWRERLDESPFRGNHEDPHPWLLPHREAQETVKQRWLFWKCNAFLWAQRVFLTRNQLHQCIFGIFLINSWYNIFGIFWYFLTSNRIDIVDVRLRCSEAIYKCIYK